MKTEQHGSGKFAHRCSGPMTLLQDEPEQTGGRASGYPTISSGTRGNSKGGATRNRRVLTMHGAPLTSRLIGLVARVATPTTEHVGAGRAHSVRSAGPDGNATAEVAPS